MSSNRWSYFIWGLLISLLLGSAIRLVFSPERMQEWIAGVAAKRQIKFQLEFAEAQLTLAPSFPPNLAVRLSGVKVTAQDPCITGSVISVDDLYLPIGWMGLWRRSLEFGRITADTIRVRYRPPQCIDSLAVPALDQRIRSENHLVKVERYLKDRWKKEVRNTLRYLDSVRVRQLQLFYLEGPTPFLKADNVLARLNPVSKVAELGFQLTPSKEILGFDMLGVSHYEMQISEKKILLHGKGNLLEGRYEMSGDWDISRSEIIYEAQVKDFPAGELLQFLEKWDLLDLPNLAITNEWFKCKVQLSLATASPRTASLQNENCQLYGELGEIMVPDSRRSNVLETLFPLHFQITNFNIAAVDPKPNELEKSLLPYSGEYSGTLLLHGQQIAETTGEWRNLRFQVPVTDSKTPVFRLFDSAQVNAKISGRDVSLQLTEVRNGSGNLVGQLKLETQRRKRSMVDEVMIGEMAAGLALSWELHSKGSNQDLSEFIPGLLEVNGFVLKGEGFLQGLRWGFVRTSVALEGGSLFAADLQKLELSVGIEKGVGQVDAKLGLLNLAKLESGVTKKMQSHFNSGSLSSISLDLKFEPDGRWALNPMKFLIGDKQYQMAGRGYLSVIDQALLQVQGAEDYLLSGPLLDPRIEKAP